MSADLARLGARIVGTWTTEATHPEVPRTIVSGDADVQWLEGEHFLVFRSRNDHPDFPDSISIIGETDGLQWHYFDSRGVHRVYEMRLTDDAWEIAREAPEFSQRLTVTFHGEDRMEGLAKLAHESENWRDDLQITYRRSS